MKTRRTYSEDDLKYLKMLARQYPSIQAASTEIINLQAILNLPKGTEHFISDVHGEYEAFLHILNSASGVVRKKIDALYETSLSKAERTELAALIHYPNEKLKEITSRTDDVDEWCRIILHRLIEVCKLVSSKYTRSKVRKALPKDYAYIIDELIHTDTSRPGKLEYFENIIFTIIDIEQAPAFIIAVCRVIKRLAVDRLHIVGDIFDRGPRADIIMDSLQNYHSLDIQWGNHDVLWMGAASGSRTLIATVLANSIHYNNLEVIETGYGISLRPLAVFANEAYSGCDVSRFDIKLVNGSENAGTEKDKILSARMYKAITIILLKLEGQKILNHPEFGMEDRLLLDKIDYKAKSININGVTYHLEDTDFPTVDPASPYTLTCGEDTLMNELISSFRHSEKLQSHIRFLYSKGGLYKIYNGNLMYHGCMPMDSDGNLLEFSIGCDRLSGRAFLDYAESVARKAFYDKKGSPERQFGLDFLWFLWAGHNSPIFGRDRMTTFERRFIDDKDSWEEVKNPYYDYYNKPEICASILKEFGLEGNHSHIINGHVPVESKKGESPIKAGGKLIVIDGGFCKAYQPTTGIGGYTLIYNSRSIRIVSHDFFAGRQKAIKENKDIPNTSNVFEQMESRIKIEQTDVGSQIKSQVEDLLALLNAYKCGAVTEDNHH